MKHTRRVPLKTAAMRLIEIHYGEPIEQLYGRWLSEDYMTYERMSQRLNNDGIDATFGGVHAQVKRLGGRDRLMAAVQGGDDPETDPAFSESETVSVL